MKHVYFFGGDQTEGKKEMKQTLGGKGANLAEMAAIGVPVPAGFTITTETCAEYYDEGKKISEAAKQEIDENVKKLEKFMEMKLGDTQNPLLLSVRSGAAVSMPGMMDTILNLGINDEVAAGIAEKTSNPRFAWDSYRRFIQMFGDVVMGVEHHDFEKILDTAKETKGVQFDTDLSADDLKEVTQKYKELVKEKTGKEFPTEAKEQLLMAVEAVFGSWKNDRANHYRRLNDIRGLKGTAVNVQAMVFGNMGETSGTGVCFSRDPSTGENVFYGEYLMNAQGEDVVAGIRTPQPITQLKEVMPEAYEELVAIYKKLELHYKDMQDMEFTIQDKKLYMLQTRNGKRTAAAAVRMAIEMIDEGLIDEKTAILRVDPASLDQLLHKQLDVVAKEKHQALGKGLPASPGGAVGKIAFNNDSAVKMKEAGDVVILVRNDTSPEDLIGMDAAAGILTAKGGMTSHAAVVARGMGKCCVSGLGEAKISEANKSLELGGEKFTEGDYITLDGSSGEVFSGKIPTTDPELSGNFGKLMELADKHRKLGVRTNAETPRDCQQAVKFGAEGIGLCRTEHMFFEGERIKAVREMIMSEDLEGRKKALAKIKPFQKQDFYELFKIMNGKPITIRLLDPPLHEFLPREEADIKELSTELGVTVEQLKQKIESLHEVNPMLGHRGCRLGVTYPEITEMQSEAIFEAAKEISESGVLGSDSQVTVEVMVPLIGNVEEFKNQKEIIIAVANKVLEGNDNVKYMVGTMIEVPRAALTADLIAKEAEFFSFGTNDLTQMTLGFSRDDVGSFVPEYIEKGILERDPFQALDQTGVGQLVEMAAKKGRATNEKIKLGICGEHGGEPSSVEFCHKVGLNYVSCSPFRVPIARLAAAQAALKEN
ncbi:pyruvate, phosphate dikinase [Candidatus Woesearchaeota archaeon]|nr:pyruvate, phosphate dikinase [Candidatus Woesearchaeota archaeon]MCF7900635.1 pyruvate, phosphate dikinase [Candidatus Woesearchaeota archaeon]MCF8013475.1 pyruvate, phosphate dikinase [Candidatus Woesearchaeota archaeon]